MNDYSPREDYDDDAGEDRLRPGGKYWLAVVLWLVCGTFPAYASAAGIVYLLFVQPNNDVRQFVFPWLIGGWLAMYSSFTYQPLLMMFKVKQQTRFHFLNMCATLVVYFFGGWVSVIVALTDQMGYLVSVGCFLGVVGLIVAEYCHRFGYEAAVIEYDQRREKMAGAPGSDEP